MKVRRDFSERAEAELDAIYRDLQRRRGHDAAEAWLRALIDMLEKEILFLSTPARRAIDADYSRKVGTDTFPLILRSWGAWRVFYQLLDEDRDGEIELLAVASIRSATGGDN